MIDSNTKMLGVIGDPINHSLSPIMHNFVIKKLGLNYCYHAFHVTPEYLEDSIFSFDLLKFKGINVTLPHKRTIMSYIDEISEEAKQLGAVNTVSFKDNKLFGYNTDVIGFLKSLGEFRETLKGKTAIVIGAGGSARAVIYALIKDGIGEIKIFNRTQHNADKLKTDMNSITYFNKIYSLPFSADYFADEIQNASILINTTPVGMYPDVNASPINCEIEIPAKILVYNLIYNPLETKLLINARQAGAPIKNGLDMLIFQGLESLQIWTGENFNTQGILPELRNFLIKRIGDNGKH
jgi:shikimate dehydrogenase